MKAALASCAFALALFAGATPPQAPGLLLGTNVVPQRYRVDLTLTPSASTFHGVVEIDVRIAEATRIIWLNAINLNISSTLFRAGGAEIVPALTPEQHGFIALEFDHAVSGAATLRFEYDGKVARNSSAGVFALQEDGEWYLYSQFETSDARRAFPCFDQPSFKVPWRITLHVPAAASAFANTPEESASPESGGMKAVRFRESKPLPSYLVAFAAGRFETVDAGRVEHTPLRVIVPRGHAADARFAVTAIPGLLALEEKYFGRPYPYEKLDSIVMPISNFAMENAGLITYGQGLLLARPGTDTIHRQRECAATVAHEMAHQWFGDLVTMRWWDDVWLNEAFASWMEEKVVGEWKPEWRVNVAAVQERLRSMDLDSLVSARRIVQPIESDSDIANAFDDITYVKGAAVLGMFEHFAGTQSFQRGVRAYLNRYEWRNATTAEFLAAVSEGAGINPAPAFVTFLNQAGTPLVTADLDCSGVRPLLHLSQKRSLPVGSPGSAEQTWRIPVFIRYRDGGGMHNQRILLESRHDDAALTDAQACPTWLLANDEAAGYYRVRYAGGLLDHLLAHGGGELSAAERVSELGNVKALVATGDAGPALALALVPEFSGDPDGAVVEAAMAIASTLTDPAIPDGLRPNAARYIHGVFGKRAEALGWHSAAGDSEDTRLLRSKLVPFAAAEGRDQALIDGARSLGLQWLKDRSGVEPDMVEPVLSVAAQFGDRGLWEIIHQQAVAEKDPAIVHALLRALGSFRDRTLAEASLRLLATREFDPRQTFSSLLRGPLEHAETRDLPFDLVRESLDALLTGLPREVGGDFSAELPRTANAFCDPTRRQEVDGFFRERVKGYTGGERTLRNTLETIDLCIARKQAQGPALTEFLKAY